MFIKDYIYGKAKAADYQNYSEEERNKGIYPEDIEALKTGKPVKEVLRKYVVNEVNNLVLKLNNAASAYYNGPEEIMSNFEYDKLYDDLLGIESRFGYIRSDSPTRLVGFEVKGSLEKEKHEFAALSLNKTKDPDEIKAWLGDQNGALSWKLDGLTVQLTYDNGTMTKAVTRGNGEIGENVSHNARFFKGIPEKISFKDHLVVRGEALISYEQFDKINNALPTGEEKYKNPRNLASGSVRQLDAKEACRRHIEFKAFELVYAEGLEDKLSKFHDRFEWLQKMGFDIVEYYIVDKSNLFEKMYRMKSRIEDNEFPSDGLVLVYDDIKYGKSLGKTEKYPRYALAFKWEDETAKTTLRNIEWSASRTGLINPVVEFDPVDLEGTIVSRASVHNISYIRAMKLGIGDQISVYKANMIIPQIAENFTKSNALVLPDKCPVCGCQTEIITSDNNDQKVETLHCTNPDCQAKHIGKFTHFVERDRMNIAGMSEATIEKLVDLGIIKEFKDIYHLNEHKDEIVSLEGMGERSFDKLIKAIEKSRKVKLEKLIAALGIPNIGRDAGKKISKALKGSITSFNKKLEEGNFLDIEDMGEISNDCIVSWYKKQKEDQKEGKSEYFNLLVELDIEEAKAEAGAEAKLSGKTFVITGSLSHYKNRNELISVIEGLGGKVSGSVSKKTSYLINNDTESATSKNQKAKELGVKIISEEDFQKLIA